MGTKALPLGIDVGETRVRVARLERSEIGSARLVAVASREFANDGDRDSLLPLLIEELVREVGGKHRDSVVCVAPSDGAVAFLQFPKMSWSERRRAAAFESARIAPWNVKDVPTLVRVRSVNRDEGRYAVGVARKEAVAGQMRVLRCAKLRASHVDHEGCALRRAFPLADAVVDVASSRTKVHAYGPRGVTSAIIPLGGAYVTRGIGTELKIGTNVAEKRKRVLGTAGAGDTARSELIEHIASAIATLKSAAPIRRIALVGNGARLSGLDAHLEDATGCIVEFGVSPLLLLGEYPEDVVRAAAPDWTLAVALALWSR